MSSKTSLSIVIVAKKSRVVELKPVPSRDLVLPVHPQEDNARGGALIIKLKICLRARFAQMNGQTVKSDHKITILSRNICLKYTSSYGGKEIYLVLPYL